jgi:cell division protein FtsB
MFIIMNVVRTILPLMVTAMLNIIIFLTIRNRNTARATMELKHNIETEDLRWFAVNIN